MLGRIFHRIFISLLLGIIATALIATHGNLLTAASLIGRRFSETCDLNILASGGSFFKCDTILIVAFSLITSSIVEMIHASGGARSLIKTLTSSIRGKKSAETSSLILSHCLFIDDYLSCLTTASVLRPLTDQHRIPRVKLAFLVDIMAASLAVLCPVSSWAVAIIGFLNNNGIGLDVEREMVILIPSNVAYLRTLPYIFYSFTVITTAWFIVRRRLTFGLMKTHERIADETGYLFGKNKEIPSHDENQKNAELSDSSLADFLLPIVILIGSAFPWLLYWGNYHPFDGGSSLIIALQNSYTAAALFSASATSLILSVVYYLSRRRFSLRMAPRIMLRGMQHVYPALIILISSWTLGALIREDIHMGSLIARIIGTSLPLQLFPLVFFWTAIVMALVLGTTWGTAAILFPIAIQLVVSLSGVTIPASADTLAMLFPVLGAILSGGICGCNMSIISGNAILSSTSASCHHVDHINTQWRYALIFAFSTSIGFIATGFLVIHSLIASMIIPLLISISLGLIIFTFFDRISRRKSPSSPTANGDTRS